MALEKPVFCICSGGLIRRNPGISQNLSPEKGIEPIAYREFAGFSAGL
jgi:hypothetical protein